MRETSLGQKNLIKGCFEIIVVCSRCTMFQENILIVAFYMQAQTIILFM